MFGASRLRGIIFAIGLAIGGTPVSAELGSLVPLDEHRSEIRHIAVSPDGSRIASIDSDGVFLIRDAASGLVTLKVERVKRAQQATFLRKTDAIAVAAERFVYVVDVKDGSVRWSYKPTHSDPGLIFLSVAVSPDETSIAAGTNTGQVLVWPMTESRPAHELTMGTGGGKASDSLSLNFVGFTPDGAKIVAAGGIDGKVGVWETRSGASVRTWAVSLLDTAGAALSPDGKTLVTTGLPGRGSSVARVWDLASGRAVGSPKTRTERGEGVAYSSDGRFLLLYGRQSGVAKIEIFDAKRFASVETIELSGKVSALVASNTGLLFASEGGKLFSIPREKGQSVRQIGGALKPASARILQVGERSAIVMGGDRRISYSLWTFDVTDGGIRDEIVVPAPSGLLTDPSVSGDLGGFLINLGAEKDRAIFTDLRKKTVKSFDYPGLVGFARLFRDGERILLSAYKSGSSIVNQRTGAKVALPSPSISAFAEDEPRDRFAVLSRVAEDKYVVDLWSGRDLRKLYEMPVRSSGTKLAFSPDGSRLVALSSTVHHPAVVFDTATGREVNRFESVQIATFSRDGKILLSGNGDGELTLWNVDTGRRNATWKAAPSYFVSLAFTDDDRRIVAIDGAGAIRTIDARRRELLTTTHVLINGSWISQTPEGYFTTNAKTAAVFKVAGAGAQASAEVIETHRRPDLVREKLAGDPEGKVSIAATGRAPEPVPERVDETPTHVVVSPTRARHENASFASGTALAMGDRVRLVKSDGERALIARDGDVIGYVPSNTLMELR